jgi:hypothetical protein
VRVGLNELILMEAPSSAYHSGMLALGKQQPQEEETLMQFYTGQHKFYCGIDLHARTMYLCIMNQAGEILLHRNMKAAPEPFLKAITPYREDLVVCVECIFTWDLAG